jgi:methylase of polypeptide subunit release factors
MDHSTALQTDTVLPLRLASEENFRTARDFFWRAGFEEASVCRAAGIEGIAELGMVRWEERETELQRVPAALRWCIQIFLRGLRVPESESRLACEGAALEALHNIGLVRRSEKKPEALLCPVWVYPVDGFVMASDRRDDPEGGVFNPPADVVFPAIYPGTLRFLKLIPGAPDGEALDLCGGSGIGGLRLSRAADQAVTADITPRSAFFAEFNARLNGTRVASLCGDLYEPVAGRQFDIISAHPPFVPAIGDKMVYRDGGATGEEITRRIIEGLASHLRIGGTAVVLGVVRDTEEQAFEQRAFEWLGPEREHFDVIFGLEKVLSVAEVVDSMRKRGSNFGAAQAAELMDRLRSFKTKQFVYGALVVRRCAGRIDEKPARVRMTAEATFADFERLLAWRTHCRRADLAEWLMRAAPRMAPQLELTARHHVRGGDLVPAEFVFSIENGFIAGLRIDGWAVPLIARMDGRQTVADIFEQARQDQELPENFRQEAFSDLVRMLIGRGFLVVE